MNRDRTAKIWLGATSLGIAVSLSLIASVVWYVDPYFVFRSPRAERFRYVLDNGRCQNPGIMKNFDFEMMVVGSSMSENFKASEFSKAFGLRCVKLPYTGGAYREYREAVQYANSVTTNLQLTIVCLDLNKILLPADWLWLPGEFSPGLEFTRPMGKLKYLFYPDAVAKAFVALVDGGTPGVTSFDDFQWWWREDLATGKTAVVGNRQYDPNPVVQHPYSAEDRTMGEDGIAKNIIPMIASSRRIIFFFSPYSLMQWYRWRQFGDAERFLAAERQYMEAILKHKNARVFSWNDRVSLVGNLENYTDAGHYSAMVNSKMVEWMRDGVGEITEDSKEGYFEREGKLIREFDYEAFFR